MIEEVKEIAEVITLSDGTQVTASKFLDLFLFPPEKQYINIQKLSGGEKKRLQLLKILVTNPNFLILDEPTNDFDIDTLNVLEDFLEKYTGCLVLVSHDRYFMDHLVDELFIFEGDGKIKPFNGNYSDYRAREDEDEPAEKKDILSRPVSIDPERQKRKPSYKEKQEHDVLQREIEMLEEERKMVIEKLTNNSLDHLQLQEYSSKVERITTQIDEKMLRWLELDEFTQ